MTYDDVMFANFTIQPIELPYSCANSIHLVSSAYNKQLRVSSKVQTLSHEARDCTGMRLNSKIQNLVDNLGANLTWLQAPLTCQQDLSDLDYCTYLVEILKRDKLTDFAL
jgi:hypothetical protein